MNTQCTNTNKQQLLVLIACLFLFMGIGRIFNLVMNDPVLGYANSYDMIRLQACHQIWPADKFIDSTVGTPSAPIRRYTLDKHVDTLCFPSSELLFTGIGIELGKLKNKITSEVLISIKTIGFVKAAFLSLTILLASLFFYRKAMYSALLANALVTLLVLSDPAVTLYMNTFYTEFSAVYFLYLALIGVAVLAKTNYRFTAAWVLLIGLVGLGLSKPQHIPLTLLLGVVMCWWIARQQAKRILALVTLCTALIPLALQMSGNWAPRNATMAYANRVDLVGALLSASNQKTALLESLQLPANCAELAGKNWFSPEAHQESVCRALADASHIQLLLVTAIHHPAALAAMAHTGIPTLKQWLYPLYGQVEGRTHGNASDYRYSVGALLEQTPSVIFLVIWLLPLLIITTVLVLSICRKKYIAHNTWFIFLLTAIQWFVFATALYGDGMVDLAKHAYLSVAALITIYIVVALTKFFPNNLGTSPEKKTTSPGYTP